MRAAYKRSLVIFSIQRWLSLISNVDELENHQLNTELVFDVEYDTDDDSNADLHPKYIQKYTTRFQSIAVLLNRIYRSTLVIFIFSPFAEYGFWRINGQSVPYPHILTSWEWAPLDGLYFMRLSIARKQKIPKNSLVYMIGYWLRNAGLWKDVSHTKIHWLTKVAMSIFLGTVLLQTIDLFMARDDPERLFECFSVFTFCAMGALKLYTIVGSHERWLSLISNVDELENHQLNTELVFDVEYDTDDDSNADLHPKYIQKYTTRFQSIAVLLNRIYRSTLVIFIFSPFAEYGFWRINGQSVPYPHILTSWEWAPLDGLYFVGYAVTVAFEAISAVYCVFVHIAFDLTTVGLMIFICGQFELLRKYSERIAGSGKHCNVSKKRDDRAHFRIIKCHRTHILLVKSITELNQLVKDILGVYLLVTTLTLCSVAVRLNTEELSVMQLLSLLQYMCATLTQLYLFCHYGDGVLHESSVNMGEGPFGSAYWCLSPKIRRELTLLSIGLCQKRCIKAGPFNSLDLPTFIKVLKTAYSYYAVVRK